MALGGVATCALTLLSPVVSTAIATVGALAALATYRRDGRRLALVSTWPLAGIGSIPLVLPAILLAVVACKGAESARSRPPWLLAIATLALVRAVAAAYS